MKFRKEKWMTGAALGLGLVLVMAGGCKKKESAPIRPYGVSRAGGEIVARVGEREISGRELAQSVNAYSQSLLQRGQKPPPDFEDSILNILIESELLYQTGLKMDIPDRESRAEEMYGEIAARFVSPQMMAEALSRDGMTPAGLRESLKRKVVIQTVLDEKVYSQVEVSEEEIEKYYQSHREELEEPERIKVRQIQLTFPRNATPEGKEALKEKALGLKKRIDGGEDLSALAREFSEAPDRETGGEMGFFIEGQLARLDPALEKAAWALKTGEVSEPVETRIGYHLIMVDERLPARIPSLEESREKIGAGIKGRKTPEILDRLIAEIKKEIPVEKLVSSGEKDE